MAMCNLLRYILLATLTTLFLFACVKPKPYIASLAVVEKAQPERVIMAAPDGCGVCHKIFAKRLFYSYYPVRISHRTHSRLGIECTFCHRNASFSTMTDDYLMPAGHTFGNETAETPMPDKNPCRTCHLYFSEVGRKDRRIPGKCKTCHRSYAAAKPLQSIRWVYSTNLKNNHKAHSDRGIPCLRCHVGFDTLESSVFTYIPKMDLCNECHGNRTNTKPAAGKEGDALEAGKRLYMRNCVPCHGREGKGDGPVAAFFTAGLRPRDLTNSVHMARRSNQQLFDVIFYGGPELTLSERMPAWNGLLTRYEVKLLVKYVRSLSISDETAASKKSSE